MIFRRHFYICDLVWDQYRLYKSQIIENRYFTIQLLAVKQKRAAAKVWQGDSSPQY